MSIVFYFFSIRRRHTRCALVTGVQTCALPISQAPIPVVPGGATPTEFLALMARGFRVCKLFPANAVGGLAMLKGLAGPLADLALCPTGGISEDNAAEFLAQPNVACVGGSWMVPRPWLAAGERSEEHTSELQSLMRISYAVFCLKQKQNHIH